VSPATVSRYLARVAVVPKASQARKSSRMRFAAELPDQRWQADLTHWPLADEFADRVAHLREGPDAADRA